MKRANINVGDKYRVHGGRWFDDGTIVEIILTRKMYIKAVGIHKGEKRNLFINPDYLFPIEPLNFKIKKEREARNGY